MLEILYKYLNFSLDNNLSVDKTYLRNLLNFFVRYYHLYYYINRLDTFYEPYDQEDYLTAEYGDKKVNVNIRGINEELATTFSTDTYFKNFTSYEKNLFKYTYFIEVIAHEVYHARELRNLHSTKDNLEKRILYPIRWTLPGYDNVPNYKRLFNIYEKYYKVCPTERFACYDSITLCCELLKKMPESEIVKNEFVLRLLSSLLNPYDISPNPTKYFLEKAHAKSAWPSIEKETPKLSLARKLIYGFDIPKPYYDKLLNKMFELD